MPERVAFPRLRVRLLDGAIERIGQERLRALVQQEQERVEARLRYESIRLPWQDRTRRRPLG